jgi:hypothetical protein
LFDPLDGGDDLVGVGRIADLEGVVQHDALVVVGDLGLVAELDGRAEPSLADGPSVGFVLDTIRVAPDAMAPPTRVRAWSTTRSVIPMRSLPSLIICRSRPALA